MNTLKVLDLFAGTRSIARAFEERGHKTYSIEWDRRHPNIDWYVDIFEVTAQDIIERFGKPDVIWASPPCNRFSVASIGKHWIKGTNLPKTEEAKEALRLLEHTVKLIHDLNPTYWYIENPRGKMRKLDIMQDLPRYTVTYCLRGDTRVITKQGTYEIKDLVGKDAELLTTGGKWVKAPVRNYGKQRLMKLTISRAKKEKVIYATPNHKWFVGDKVIETKDLEKGQKLNYVKTELVDVKINKEWVARGFVYGDGWILDNKPKGFVQFCGEKHELLPYFDGIGGKRWRDDKGSLKITKLYGYPKEWKTNMPSLDEDPSNIFSWLAGYLAADGTVHKNNAQITISSSKREDLEKVRDLCRVVGIDTYSIVEYRRKGYGKETTPLFQVTLMRSDVPRDMIIRKKHLEAFDKAGEPKHQPRKWKVVSVEETDLFEDVYCAEVPETHAFALEDGILTHNCQYGDTRMKPTDIWTNHPNPKFKPPCKNGDTCHVAAPRGSRTGTQGINNAIDRARIPDELCRHIVRISEEVYNGKDYKL